MILQYIRAIAQQVIANEPINQTKKRSPSPGIAGNFNIKASGLYLKTFLLQPY